MSAFSTVVDVCVNDRVCDQIIVVDESLIYICCSLLIIHKIGLMIYYIPC